MMCVCMCNYVCIHKGQGDSGCLNDKLGVGPKAHLNIYGVPDQDIRMKGMVLFLSFVRVLTHGSLRPNGQPFGSFRRTFQPVLEMTVAFLTA